jgi:hypothetical protein
MQGIAALLKESCPAQPPLAKFVTEKPGETTAINTSSSKIASRVTTSSKVAAICTPMILSVMNITYAPTAAALGGFPGNCT